MSAKNNNQKELQRKIQMRVTLIGLIGILIAIGISMIFAINELMESKSFAFTRMFDDVSELSVLDEYTVEDAPKLNDPNVVGLDYTASYLNTVEYDGREYKVYAYEFADKKTALEYFDRVGDERSPNLNWSCYTSGSLWEDSTFIGFHDNCVLVVVGYPMNQVKAFVTWLSPHLSVDLNSIPKWIDE